jgi:hypothetical protein
LHLEQYIRNMKQFLLLGLITLSFACQQPEQVRNANITLTESDGKEYVLQKIDTTSVRTDKPLAEEEDDLLLKYANEVIAGKRTPSADPLSTKCLQEMNSEDPEKRAFFFKVYRKMLLALDEGLSEVPAHYVTSYFKKYPREALSYYRNFNKKEKEQFISHLAYDFWVSGNSENTIPAWINIENPDIKPFEPELIDLSHKMVATYKD